MKKIVLSVCITILLLMSFSSAFATPQDLITEKRFNIQAWEVGTLYELDDTVSYEGVLYTSTRRHVSVTPPDLDLTKYELKEYNSLPKNPNFKNGQFQDKTFYNGQAAVKGHNLTGLETFVLGRQLVGLADYNPDNFTVTMFTGNDGVPYSIYSYHNETDPSNLQTDPLFIRQNGTYLFDVVSENGFITYQTNGFSTQIASIPNQNLAYTTSVVLDIGDYFSSYTEDEVFVWVPAGSSAAGCDSLINSQCRIEKGGAGVSFTPFDAQHYTSVGNDLLSIQANSASYSDDVIIAVNDGSDFISDSFVLTVAPASDPEVSTPAVTGVTTTTATLNGVLSDLGSESSVNLYFEFCETGFVNCVDYLVFSGVSGSVTYTKGLAGLTPGTEYQVTAWVDGATQGYYGNTVYFSTTGTGGTAPTGLDSIVSYWALEDLTDLTGNGSTLTANGGVSSGSPGIIDNSYTFDGTDDYLSVSNPAPTGASARSFSFWVKPTHTEQYGVVSSYGTESGRGSFNIYTEATNDLIYIGDNVASYQTPANTIAWDVWNHVVITYDGSLIKAYINGTLQYTSSSVTLATNTGSTFTLGRYGPVAAQFYQGNIDEYSIYSSALSQSDITYLFDSGTPGVAQQYPFTQPLNPPIQDTPLPDFDVNEGASSTIDLTNYFTNFTTFNVSYINPDTDTPVVLSGATDTDTNTYFTINTVDGTLTKSIQVVGISATPLVSTNNLTIIVCNVDGCINDTIATYINDVPVLPTQLADLPAISVEVGQTVSYDLDNYFSGFDNLTIIYTQPTGCGGDFCAAGTTTYNNTYYTLTFDNVSNVMNITGLTVMSAEPYGVQATNVDGSIQDSSTVTVYAEGGSPPSITFAIPDVEVDINEPFSIDLTDYITNFATFNVSYTNPDSDTTVVLSGATDTDTNSYFKIDTVDGTLTKGITITGISATPLVYLGTITVTACSVGSSCTSTTFNTAVTSTVYIPPTPPSELDSFLDDFGNQGSSTMRLIIGLFIILGMMLAGWYYTRTLAISFTAGVIGLIITVALGLISIWLVLLIILITLIPILYKVVFGNRGA